MAQTSKFHKVKRQTIIEFVEFIVWCALFATTWLPSPQRDNWIGLVIPIAILTGLRLVGIMPPFSTSRFTPVILVILALDIVSIYTAPYSTRGWILLFRPAYGFWMMSLWTTWLQSPVKRRALWILTLGLGVLVSVMGLTATQWTGKAARYSDITDHFPEMSQFSWWEGGFNANEWAGAAAWLLPLFLIVALHPPISRRWRWASGGLALVMGALLFLGQSLSGLLGAAAGIAFGVIPRRWLRPALIGAGGILLIGNLAVLLFPAQSADVLAEISGRPNITSLEHRSVIWQRANRMIVDYPLTGVGIALYRSLRVEYPTPGFEHALVPHPHNEALQFATDLGIPGLIVHGWLVVVVGTAALNVVTNGSPVERTLALALIAGLFGHAVYGLTDAIPIWDRFSFILWWLLGLLSGLDAAISARRSAPAPDIPPSV